MFYLVMKNIGIGLDAYFDGTTTPDELYNITTDKSKAVKYTKPQLDLISVNYSDLLTLFTTEKVN